MAENWLKRQLNACAAEVRHWIPPIPEGSSNCLNAYNDGLEAAALYLERQAKYTEITNQNRSRILFKKAGAIRALKESDDG